MLLFLRSTITTTTIIILPIHLAGGDDAVHVFCNDVRHRLSDFGRLWMLLLVVVSSILVRFVVPYSFPSDVVPSGSSVVSGAGPSPRLLLVSLLELYNGIIILEIDHNRMHRLLHRTPNTLHLPHAPRKLRRHTAPYPTVYPNYSPPHATPPSRHPSSVLAPDATRLVKIHNWMICAVFHSDREL